MRRICEIIKKVWQVAIAVLVWLLLCCIIYAQTEIQISDRIQALAIITLVFVTIFYARQTQRLVKEQQKKWTADFWEDRIIKFYKPFMERLDTIRIKIHRKKKNPEILLNKIDELRHFFIEKKYMISEETSQQVDSLQDALWSALLDDVDLSISNFLAAEEEVRKVIYKEWNEIESSIRKFYGY